MSASDPVSPEVQARILSEALPYMRRYAEETIVVKYGGHAMGDANTRAAVCARYGDAQADCGLNPIVVHGGGPQISQMLGRDIREQADSREGLRVTDDETMSIVEMVLAGSINKAIVASIRQAGGRAVGISGKDGNMVVARKLTRTVIDPDSAIEKVIDLGYVGEPEKVDTTVLTQFRPRGSSRRWHRSPPRPISAPSTSMPTPLRGRSPPRSRPSACCCLTDVLRRAR